jgi:hypothetical protein
MALGSTQPLTEMSTRNSPGGVKGGRRVRLTTLLPTASLDFSRPYGPSRSVTGSALPLPYGSKPVDSIKDMEQVRASQEGLCSVGLVNVTTVLTAISAVTPAVFILHLL